MHIIKSLYIGYYSHCVSWILNPILYLICGKFFKLSFSNFVNTVHSFKWYTVQWDASTHVSIVPCPISRCRGVPLWSIDKTFVLCQASTERKCLDEAIWYKFLVKSQTHASTYPAALYPLCALYPPLPVPWQESSHTGITDSAAEHGQSYPMKLRSKLLGPILLTWINSNPYMDK